MIKKAKVVLCLLLTTPGFLILALVSMAKSAIGSLEVGTIDFLQAYSHNNPSANLPEAAMGDLGFKIIYSLYLIDMYSMIIIAISLVWIFIFSILIVKITRSKQQAL